MEGGKECEGEIVKNRDGIRMRNSMVWSFKKQKSPTTRQGSLVLGTVGVGLALALAERR